jgi:surface protein
LPKTHKTSLRTWYFKIKRINFHSVINFINFESMFKKYISLTAITTVLLNLLMGVNLAQAVPDPDFVITVDTNEMAGGSLADMFLVVTSGGGYNYNIDCNNDGVDEATGVNGDYLCDYGVDGLNTGAGVYTVRISDNSGAGTGFPRIYFSNGGERLKITSVDNWGTGTWTSFEEAFYGCSNLQINAGDRPILTGVTSMSKAFKDASILNADLNSWDVSNVQDFSEMFHSAYDFNGNIVDWDVSNGQNFSGMFAYAYDFDKDISGWDVSAGVNFSRMFSNADSFNRDIGGWDVALGQDFSSMFAGNILFNQDIGSWDTGSAQDMSYMFENTRVFNQDIGSWDTADVTDMRYMFNGAEFFNQDISGWDFTSLGFITYMFKDAVVFNQDISGWDVSGLNSLANLFEGAEAFNQDISSWDVSGVQYFGNMFDGAITFDQDISGWDMSSALQTYAMFNDATSFNQDISGWDVSSVNTMSQMFDGAIAFDQDISGWDVSGVSNMSQMFSGAINFDQDLGNWDVSSAAPGFGTGMDGMFQGVTLSMLNYNSLLTSWDALAVNPLVQLNGGNSRYCGVAVASHNNLVTPPPLGDGWTIVDGGAAVNCAPMITSNGGGVTADINLAENNTAVTTVTANEADAGDTLAYSITGGADQAKFNINPVSGALTFVSAPDFENPTDDGTNNTYIVEVTVTDDGVVPENDSQVITVTVTDVAESSGGSGIGFTGSGSSSSGSSSSSSSDDSSDSAGSCEATTYELELNFEVPADWFSDASADHEAYNALMSLAAKGVVNGSGEDHLANLDQAINRAEISKIVSIAREDTVMLGSSCEDNTDFTDLFTNEWYYGYVKNLEESKILNGHPDGSFKPGDNTLVAEAYKILAISFDLITKEEADAKAATDGVEWYVPYVEAVQAEITVPAFIETEMGANITRGDFFYLLNALM